MTSEFSRPVDSRHLGERPLRIEANDAERARLAERFGIEAIHRLAADVALTRAGPAVLATGRFAADIVQSCAVSGEPLAVAVAEPIALRFVPAADAATLDEEVELAADDCDEIEFTGHAFDLGEAVAQSLALAIDPYLEGPDAERVRAEAGLLAPEQAGPFAALAALKK
ncbi:MAG: DUF177 domain-containing protein [Novosphingobium sp.]